VPRKLIFFSKNKLDWLVNKNKYKYFEINIIGALCGYHYFWLGWITFIKNTLPIKLHLEVYFQYMLSFLGCSPLTQNHEFKQKEALIALSLFGE
jgi:hypothetical protein